MIEVNIKMKNDKYDHIIEEFFTNFGNLTKDTKEHYYTNGNGLGTVYGRCKDLCKEEWFRNNCESLSWIVGGEEEEELKDFIIANLLKKGKI